MKKVKQEGGAGLQEWLSYQSRAREVSTRHRVQPETDVIDWDEGIEVQEEWLPRELCEQRLREESERKLTPTVKSVTAQSTPPITTTPSPAAAPGELAAAAVVEVEDVLLAAAAIEAVPATAVPPTSTAPAMIDKQPEIRENSARDSQRELKSKPAPTQFETNDLGSAVPAFQR